MPTIRPTASDLPILLTRPVIEADRLEAQLRSRDVSAPILISPLMRIDVTGPLPAIEGGVILTSSNAVAAFQRLGGAAGYAAWVVGPRTAEMAKAAGFDVQVVARDADDLVARVGSAPMPLVHLRGGEQRGDVVRRLTEQGAQVEDAVIYEQVAVPLSEVAQQAIATGRVCAPLYSPRTARLLYAAVPDRQHANIQAICLSPAVAKACANEVRAVAPDPTGAAMIATILDNLPRSGG